MVNNGDHFGMGSAVTGTFQFTDCPLASVLDDGKSGVLRGSKHFVDVGCSGRHIPGALTIVRDRSNTHDHAALVRRYLARHPEIVTEKFPGYAPELNPPEQVWTYTKYARLPNFAPCHTSDLRMRLTYELKRLRKRPDLLLSFIRHSKLPLGP